MALAIVGVSFDLLGVLAFLRSKTTVNPLRPDKTSALVTSGVYRVTRNPMYLGLVLVLLAWAVYLASLAPKRKRLGTLGEKRDRSPDVRMPSKSAASDAR